VLLTPEDADGDGFSSCAGDCDDHDLAAFPGAGEICEDGSDNDCDGLVDEEDTDDCDPGDDDTGDDDTWVGDDDTDWHPDDDDTSVGDDDTAATNDCECRVAPASPACAAVVLAALGLLATLRRR